MVLRLIERYRLTTPPDCLRMQRAFNSAIDFTTVPDGDDEDLKLAIPDFVNNSVVAQSYSPPGPTIEFLYVVWTWITFQRCQTR